MAGELILVVDDEEQLCTMVGQYLESEGFRSIRADDGRGKSVV